MTILYNPWRGAGGKKLPRNKELILMLPSAKTLRYNPSNVEYCEDVQIVQFAGRAETNVTGLTKYFTSVKRNLSKLPYLIYFTNVTGS